MMVLIVPILSLLSYTGIIHGDLRDQNIIVKPVDNGRHEVSGILDFALLMHGCFVFELAVAITYLMIENPNPLDVGGAVLAGYESILLLNEEEKDSLFLLVLGTLSQSLVYGRHNHKTYPENKYLLTTAKSGPQILKNFFAMGKEEVERKWFSDASKYSSYVDVANWEVLYAHLVNAVSK